MPLNFVIEQKSPKASKKSPNLSKKSPNTSKKLPKVDKKSLKERKKKRRKFVDDDTDYDETKKDVSNSTLDPENLSHPEKEENNPTASTTVVTAQTSSTTADKSKSSTITAEPSKNSSKATAAETVETSTTAVTDKTATAAAASQNYALSLTELPTSSMADNSKQQELFSLTGSSEPLAMLPRGPLPQASSIAEPQAVKAKTLMLSATTKSKSFTSAMSSNSATSSPVVRPNHIPMQLASLLSTHPMCSTMFKCVPQTSLHKKFCTSKKHCLLWNFHFT